MQSAGPSKKKRYDEKEEPGVDMKHIENTGPTKYNAEVSQCHVLKAKISRVK
jgi:hypothetical protein